MNTGIIAVTLRRKSHPSISYNREKKSCLTQKLSYAEAKARVHTITQA